MKKFYNLIAIFIAIVSYAQTQTVTYSISPSAFNEDESITITVNGSSINESTWGVIGLEMEGAYYQKAIQSASKIRKSINPNVKVRYAYYASDNPLETGSTLASGGLGTTGVKPTYIITIKILEQIFNIN